MTDYANKRLVLSDAAFREDEWGNVRCHLTIPGVKDPKPGMVFSIKPADIERCSVDMWLEVGLVTLAPPPRAKKKEGADGVDDTR